MKFSLSDAALLAAIMLALGCTNPHEKQQYTAFMAKEIIHLVCEHSQGEVCKSVCLSNSPIIAQAMRGVIFMATDKPRNYGLMTVFRTELPGVGIWTIGIADTYLTMPINIDSLRLCQLTDELFGQDRQSLQRYLKGLSFSKEVKCL